MVRFRICDFMDFPLWYAQPMSAAFPAAINVNVSHTQGPFKTFNRVFGCDEPNYAYYTDGQKLLSELGSLGPSHTYFRTHNLLTTGDGTPRLNWTIIDHIFDTYLKNNVRPYVQAGFMPEALSTQPHPYSFNFSATDLYATIYAGWSYPPTNFEKWGELVYQLAIHYVERYGKEEVESWYWELWNEPNIRYWNGTADQFFELHDYAIAGIRRALPMARVGGCEVAGGSGDDFLGKFPDHTLTGRNAAADEVGTALDFISIHAKGAPTLLNNETVRIGISAQLQNIDDAFEVISGYDELRQKPIAIGEMDSDGCAACIIPQYGSRNGILYSSYTAASFVRALDLSVKHGVNLEGALTWAFEYDDHPYFDGFRVLSTNGIDKPVLNVHRMLGTMAGQRVFAASSGQMALEEAISQGIRKARQTLVCFRPLTTSVIVCTYSSGIITMTLPQNRTLISKSTLKG